jgi:hypothetical protein
MRNFCLLIIVIILFPAFYFSSCAKDDDSDDNQKPTVSDVAFNMNDTLWYGTDLVNPSVLRLNDSIEKRKNPELIDTIVIGKWLNISARFQDNNRLSTFKVRGVVNYQDKDGNVYLDTILRTGLNIFGMQDTAVYKNRLILISADSLQKYNAQQKKYVKAGIKEGLYELRVYCIDATGKVNLDSLKPYTIQILNRQTVKDARVK